MTFTPDDVEWPAHWHSVADDRGQVAGMERELSRELSAGHPLYGVPVCTLARRQDCDDVLFALNDGTGRVAAVHLTWTQTVPEPPPWPRTVLYSDLHAWLADEMRPDDNS